MIEIRYTNGVEESATIMIDDKETFLTEVLYDLVKVVEFAGFSAESFDFMIKRYMKYKEEDKTYTFKEFLQDEVYCND